MASSQSSHEADDLSHHLRIAISELISPMYSARVGMNNQTVVLPAAAPAQVRPISLEDNVKRLLPQRFRPAVVWLFLLSIHQRQKRADQVRVRSSRAADPETVLQ